MMAPSWRCNCQSGVRRSNSSVDSGSASNLGLVIGGTRAFFWIKQGKPDPASIHWGFMAENNVKVDEFYRAAISAGAKDNISPRARVEYYPGYYAADIFDPDGYSFEVVHKN